MKFCNRPFADVYLAPNGEVWPCSWMHYPIGNLYTQDLDEIWNSEEAKRTRESILDGSFAYCRKTSCPFLERGELEDLSVEEIEELSIVPKNPKQIFIANDKICNIACTTCRTSLFCPDKEYKNKIDNVLQNLLPYINKSNYVNINGNGEFLANNSFIQLLNKIEPQNNDFKIGFQTNGILFDEKHWKQFEHLENYNVRITVTLNSLRKEIYRYLSGGFDKLDLVIENLKFLSKLRKENKINELQVCMVVQECNYQEIPSYIKKLTENDDFSIDKITLRPVYKWFGMEEETYWFKNILNPLHPYHKEYCKILKDECWNNPKVYDWGCHNIREAKPHPFAQEKEYNKLLISIYENDLSLSPKEYLNRRIKDLGISKLGFFGSNQVSEKILNWLRETDSKPVYELTWFNTSNEDIPKISMQDFKPELADTILLADYYDRENISNNLRTLKFNGKIITLAELINGTN